jgi:hypothetical protein
LLIRQRWNVASPIQITYAIGERKGDQNGLEVWCPDKHFVVGDGIVVVDENRPALSDDNSRTTSKPNEGLANSVGRGISVTCPSASRLLQTLRSGLKTFLDNSTPRATEGIVVTA